MNKKQLGYLSKLFGCVLIKSILNYQNTEHPIPFIITEGILMAFFGSRSISLGLREKLYSLIRNYEIKTNKSKYPLENSKGVIIDDSNGLEMLLNKTAKKEDLEWGTLLNAYDDKGRAVIYNISDSKVLKNFKIPGKELSSKNEMYFNITKANELGYNGCHHYHPGNDEGYNFAINNFDRLSVLNWINLLTFNMPEGPEIIGYNNGFVYIPKDKTKKELLLASPKKIMEYLS